MESRDSHRIVIGLIGVTGVTPQARQTSIFAEARCYHRALACPVALPVPTTLLKRRAREPPLIVLRPCSMQMPPPRAQLSRRSTANDGIIDLRTSCPPPFWLWQVTCSTPAPDDGAGDLDGEYRPLCTAKPRVTTLPLVSGQVAGGTDRRPRRATLASSRGRQAGVGAARARSLLCTWCAGMVGLFPEPWVAHSGAHGGRAI